MTKHVHKTVSGDYCTPGELGELQDMQRIL